VPLSEIFVYWALGFVLAALILPRVIIWLKELRGMKWSPREDTPDSHQKKAGIASMGGLGLIGAALLACVILPGYPRGPIGPAGWLVYGAVFLLLLGLAFKVAGVPAREELLAVAGAFIAGIILLGRSHYYTAPALKLLLVTTALFALLGFADDWSKAKGRGGLLARQKLAGQILLSVGFITISYALTSTRPQAAAFWLVPLALLLMVGTSNATNLTDGIDGLLAGVMVEAGLVYGLLAHWQQLRGTQTVLIILALAGAALGFLVYNRHPARIFMGDTGSLAIGAALAGIALLTGTVLLLPFVGFICYIEMFSVIAQVAYFKYTRKKYGEGRRILLRAPLHHHFELAGWSEWRVVATFWGVNILTSICGVALWHWGYLRPFPT
jgi:phospho-N-acetylmuramoyl-pentapeptide-transferase